MNWEAIQAIGTICGAAATFFAALIALYFGLRKPKRSLSISVNFYEKSHILNDIFSPDYLILASDLDDNQADDRLLGFNVRNNSNEDIILVGFIERARFNHFPKTILKRVKRLKKKSISYPTKRGYLSIDSCFGDKHYLFGRPIKIIGREQKLLCIDYDCLKSTQSSRQESNLFDMEKPLQFFAIDIDGVKFKASFKIPAKNFLTEKTCTMRKKYWLE
ncbi:hypothetical protein VJ918_09705 [Adlercreutzia sp. R21]|uniref:hypothetical protein n=1 Tax=Adlercreutzia wanghongyangiae TaxID=3111451 RepID=UPI002DB68845|nr:hypothetical protein [Adlercreutzia sp. R21]MEC4185082.1 hypothetical protein [Adlercreutzia sp. R21]